MKISMLMTIAPARIHKPVEKMIQTTIAVKPRANIVKSVSMSMFMCKAYIESQLL